MNTRSCRACGKTISMTTHSAFCYACDLAHRATLYGYCSCGKPAYTTRGLCNTHLKRYKQDTAIARSYTGPPSKQDQYRSLIDGIIQNLRVVRPAYVAYLNAYTPRRTEHVVLAEALLLMLAVLPAKDYQYVIMQVNKGVPYGERLPRSFYTRMLDETQTSPQSQAVVS